MNMKNKIPAVVLISFFLLNTLYAQQVKFTEYDVSNGLHVILHQDKTAPVVAIAVLYHVGSKNEDTGRTGFAHFFEHLLFEGSENIKRGEFSKYVSSNGGKNNATTSHDRTFYYEVFPSNQLKLGLWLESERMMHPVINDIGVKTQNEVVKEEKRQRIDNQPYGRFSQEVFSRLFTSHPYRWQPIGSMEHLDASKLANGDFIIPQAGIIKSLNISVACAVTLYEAYRQKKLAGHYDEVRLPFEQMESLKKEWGMS